MCNLYSNRVSSAMIAEAIAAAGLRLEHPEGVPNAEPRDAIRITDRAAVIRSAGAEAAALVTMRWSWPGPTGKPLFNYRAEGRRFAPASRCLIPADGFYEYTGAKGAKTRWRFRATDADWFCIAGLWRGAEGPGACFTMLTVEPGPDVAPIHARQIAIVPRALWAGWLSGAAREAEALGPSPAGTLWAEQD